jgi:ribosomal protein L30
MTAEDKKDTVEKAATADVKAPAKKPAAKKPAVKKAAAAKTATKKPAAKKPVAGKDVPATSATAEAAAVEKSTAKEPAGDEGAPKKKAAKRTSTATPVGMIRITQVKSQIGFESRQKKVITGLGLGRIGRSVVRPDDACVRGMVAKVSHLVTVEKVEG